MRRVRLRQITNFRSHSYEQAELGLDPILPASRAHGFLFLQIAF